MFHSKTLPFPRFQSFERVIILLSCNFIISTSLVVADNPKNPPEDNILLKAFELAKENSDSASMSEIAKALCRDFPNSARAFRCLGEAYSAEGDWESAYKAFRSAVVIDHTDSKVWDGLGLASFFKGEFKEAILFLQDSIEIDPHYAPSWALMGLSYSNLGIHDQAVLALEKAVAIDPQDQKAQMWLGLVRNARSRAKNKQSSNPGGI